MPVRLVVTDLDGTLLTSQRTLCPKNLETLEYLGGQGVVRMIATGRSLHSARDVLTPALPIDYLAFSSGAGVIQWPSEKLVQTHNLNDAEALNALRVLMELGISCMVHWAIPHNHIFHYWRAWEGAPRDFERRLERYRQYAYPIKNLSCIDKPICQLLGILPSNKLPRFALVQKKLPQLNVFRTTSPLDHQSVWIEIFPPEVGKASAAAWVAARHQVALERTLAVGNDYNDVDLLDWAALGFVVENAPSPLLRRYRVVCSNDAGGFSHAVQLWERELVESEELEG